MSYKEQFDGIWNDKTGQHHVLSPDLSQRDPHHPTTGGKYGPSTPLVEHFLEQIATWGSNEFDEVSDERECQYPRDRRAGQRALIHLLIEVSDQELRRQCLQGVREVRQTLLGDPHSVYAWSVSDAAIEAVIAMVYSHLVDKGSPEAWNQDAYDFLLAPVRAVDPTIGVPS